MPQLSFHAALVDSFLNSIRIFNQFISLETRHDNILNPRILQHLCSLDRISINYHKEMRYTVQFDSIIENNTVVKRFIDISLEPNYGSLNEIEWCDLELRQKFTCRGKTTILSFDSKIFKEFPSYLPKILHMWISTPLLMCRDENLGLMKYAFMDYDRVENFFEKQMEDFRTLLEEETQLQENIQSIMQGVLLPHSKFVTFLDIARKSDVMHIIWDQGRLHFERFLKNCAGFL
jgi:hypothetical protein